MNPTISSQRPQSAIAPWVASATAQAHMASKKADAGR